MYARVHRPSILVPCATALFIVSGRVFERCNVHVAPADASNSRRRASIAARLWRAWEEKKGKLSRKDGWRYCTKILQSTHLVAIMISQLWCHYTAIIHCLWIQKHITRLLQASRLYILDSLQHQQHDRFYDTLHRQSSRTSNMTEYNNRYVFVNRAFCTVHLSSVSLYVGEKKREKMNGTKSSAEQKQSY